MTTAIVVSGRLTDEGRIELDERVPLPPGPVRIMLEPSNEPSSATPLRWLSDEEWAERRKVMDAAIGCVSDDDAQKILAVIEHEFEQIDPDEWK
jgi:hypothetical protein